VRYLLLIFDDPAELQKLDADERERIVTAYLELTAAIRRSGHFRSGNALEPVTTATTLRIRRGKRTMVDGACGGGKEDLVGYYEVEAADLDEALALAARIPATRLGAVEVRPVLRLAP
jgi:hypothetical protein